MYFGCLLPRPWCERWWNVTRADSFLHRGGVQPIEREATKEEGVNDDSEGPDVRCEAMGIILRQHLWGHEWRRTTDSLEIDRTANNSGEAEVNEFYVIPARSSHHEVVVFHVPMHNENTVQVTQRM
jgi:hypothetical protein